MNPVERTGRHWKLLLPQSLEPPGVELTASQGDLGKEDPWHDDVTIEAEFGAVKPAIDSRKGGLGGRERVLKQYWSFATYGVVLVMSVLVIHGFYPGFTSEISRYLIGSRSSDNPVLTIPVQTTKAESPTKEVVYPNGAKYVGEFNDDKRHGQGTLTWPNGHKYVGEWKEGKRHGQGTLTWPNGEKYIGEWKDGKRYGQGTLTLTDGKMYAGEFKDGKYHGQGTFTFPDGRKYIGGWKEGQPHGKGTRTNADGISYSVEDK